MYDYVIVGAGSAGCVLAARLSEDPDVKVLLIEAGPPDTTENIHVPVAFSQLFRSEVDWDYSTTAEPAADRRRLYLPRGRTLGGSSSINAMVYIRGNSLDYDAWRDDHGCQGWGWEDLLPCFLRAEDNERGASQLHGTGGPLTVGDDRAPNPITDAFLEACAQAGLPANEDFNGPSQDGFGRYQRTQRDGRRCSAALAYLHPASSRPNLTVQTYTQAHRVSFEGERAVGVQAARMGELFEFRAEREVILCGGAYNSPQLLMLSGIGPAAILGLLQIPVVQDLGGVGQNLQDHVMAGVAYAHDRPVSLFGAVNEENIAAFAQGRGPLTSNIAEAGGFIRSSDELPAPDIQFHAAPALYVDEPVIEHGFGVAPCILTPASRGMVLPVSPDPTVKPYILHNYLSEQSDMQRLTEGMRVALDVVRRPALAPYTTRPYYTPASDSDADLRAHIRQQASTVYHPVGTCRMGSDAEAVLDTELRVRGVEGLRVVDASVMPVVPRGNTNAPTIAVAERAADLIRGRAVMPAHAEAQPAVSPR